MKMLEKQMRARCGSFLYREVPRIFKNVAGGSLFPGHKINIHLSQKSHAD